MLLTRASITAVYTPPESSYLNCFGLHYFEYQCINSPYWFPHILYAFGWENFNV